MLRALLVFLHEWNEMLLGEDTNATETEKFRLPLWSVEEKWTLLDCYPPQPLSSLPWGRLTAFSKCLVFLADNERLAGSLQELFPHCCYRILGKIGSSISVSAMNSRAKQGPVSRLSFYWKINKKGPKPILLMPPVHMAKLICEVFCPLPAPIFCLFLFFPWGKLGYKKADLKFEYSDWSWMWWSTSKIGCSYPFP